MKALIVYEKIEKLKALSVFVPLEIKQIKVLAVGKLTRILNIRVKNKKVYRLFPLTKYIPYLQCR